MEFHIESRGVFAFFLLKEEKRGKKWDSFFKAIFSDKRTKAKPKILIF